jgi:hypothetical protein
MIDGPSKEDYEKAELQESTFCKFKIIGDKIKMERFFPGNVYDGNTVPQWLKSWWHTYNHRTPLSRYAEVSLGDPINFIEAMYDWAVESMATVIRQGTYEEIDLKKHKKNQKPWWSRIQ